MSSTQKTLPVPFATIQITDTAATASVQYAYAAQAKLVGWFVDNKDNSAKSYIKFWDATSGITLGSDDPEAIFMVPGSTSRMFSMPEAITFSTGVAYAVVTTGGTSGNTAPSSNLTVRLLLQP